jgi:transcriptional regulator with XRE-family HTH domain
MLLAQKEERERRKITQREVAEATKIRPPTISAWMSYEPFSRLEASIVEALCKYFNCSFNELVEFMPQDEKTGQKVAVA